MRLIELLEAKQAAEEHIGFEIPDDVAWQVLNYSIRKCEVNGKGAGYLPILFENELRDYYTRLAINLKGAMACV
ncbi:MAG: hypothetical protein IJI27_07835 [Oscillospiraceae bacterium]|nr:hypothetical protein [Oscillospiraceae bacterium]